MNDDIKMSVSSIVKKGKEKHIFVQFTDGDKIAEGRLPEGKIIYNKGFKEDEAALLETYMKKEKDNIVNMAKKVSVFGAIMKK